MVKVLVRSRLSFVTLAMAISLHASAQVSPSSEPFPYPEAPPPTLSVEEERALAHASILKGSLHNACLSLQRYGDRSSVPFLILALEMEPAVGQGQSLGLVCTTKHCYQALVFLTCQDFGPWPEGWQHWWLSSGGTLLQPPTIGLPSSAIPLP
jgi:hypothetical protein